jgi:beta-glucosidase
MNPTETVEARIKNLLSLMTLKEKICQMTQIERSVITPAIKDFTIGTLLLSTFVLLLSLWCRPPAKIV